MKSCIKSGPLAAALGAASAFFAHAGTARAVDCSEVITPADNPIYGSGGSAITPTMRAVAAALRGLPSPITVLYSDPSACTGYQEFLDNAITTSKAPFHYWDADGTVHDCTAPAVGGQPADFATMGNTPELCPNPTLPDDVGMFAGPVQGVNLIVHRNSSQTSISADALYFIYGFGAESGVEPWTIPSHINKRSNSSFVQLFLAKAIGVPATQFLALEPPWNTNQEHVNAIAASNTAGFAENTLGFVSGPTAETDANRQVVRTLAYQHTGQDCGYWPDSTSESFDKINIRNGLYYLWGANQFFAKVDQQGQIVNENVRKLVGYFAGTLEPPEGVDVNRAIIETGNIPQCAMRARRDGDLGAISSFAPANPCGCYFEAIVTNTPTCDACTSDDQCSTDNPKCRFGFCEAY